MGFKLSVEEIKKRLIRLANLEYLHKRAKRKLRRQENKIKELEEKVRELEEENKKKDEIINKFALQIEELRIKVFGKKKKKNKREISHVFEISGYRTARQQQSRTRFATSRHQKEDFLRFKDRQRSGNSLNPRIRFAFVEMDEYQ